jgi:hypothetical protein
VKASLLAVSLVPALVASAARADERHLCGRPGLDLACETVGTGFHAVPQRPGSLRTYYITMKPLPVRSAGGAAPPFDIVYGGSGYTSVWGADSLTGKPDGSAQLWSGTAKVARLLAGRGAIAVGTNDAADQSTYLDMSAGDGVAFAADLDVVQLGPRTTVEAYFDGLPSHSFQSVVGYARHGATTRLVTNRPFVKRTVSSYSGTCFWWTGNDSVCLTEYQARQPIPVYVDASGAMRKVVEAGRSPAAAGRVSGRLVQILKAQASLEPVSY